MQMVSTRTAAIRMAILLCLVVALDAAAALLIAKPQVWCAVIPGLILVFLPVVLFSRGGPSKIQS
jgi:hypothetical protein